MSRNAFQDLADAAFAFAKRMLRDEGEFHPFAVVSRDNAPVQLLGVDVGQDYPAATVVIETLRMQIAEIAIGEGLNQAGICFMGRVDRGAGKEDAAILRVASLGGAALEIVLPYVKDQDQALHFGAVFAANAESGFVFGRQPLDTAD